MKRFLSLLITIFLINPLSASTFRLDEKVIGIPDLKTECTTELSELYDYCKTQFSLRWIMFTGGNYGQLSIAYWRGTNEYSASTGDCGIKFGNKHIRGRKQFVSSNYTACFFKDFQALELYTALFEETRFEFYEPKFGNRNNNHVFYTSDTLGDLMGDTSVDDRILIGAYIHHINISSKRTAYDSPYHGHDKLAAKSPWTFAKTFARFKYYDLMN